MAHADGDPPLAHTKIETFPLEDCLPKFCLRAPQRCSICFEKQVLLHAGFMCDHTLCSSCAMDFHSLRVYQWSPGTTVDAAATGIDRRTAMCCPLCRAPVLLGDPLRYEAYIVLSVEVLQATRQLQSLEKEALLLGINVTARGAMRRLCAAADERDVDGLMTALKAIEQHSRRVKRSIDLVQSSTPFVPSADEARKVDRGNGNAPSKRYSSGLPEAPPSITSHAFVESRSRTFSTDVPTGNIVAMRCLRGDGAGRRAAHALRFDGKASGCLPRLRLARRLGEQVVENAQAPVLLPRHQTTRAMGSSDCGQSASCPRREGADSSGSYQTEDQTEEGGYGSRLVRLFYHVGRLVCVTSPFCNRTACATSSRSPPLPTPSFYI